MIDSMTGETTGELTCITFDSAYDSTVAGTAGSIACAGPPRDHRHGRSRLAFLIMVYVLSLVLGGAIAWAIAVAFAKPAAACTEATMLDFIGSLEAPGGYDTVYYGVRKSPPRPVTSMTVGQVLDWQRSTVRAGSVSSAAGRYQIIRPTLKRLVARGVVSRDAAFDAATQDRLGRHLLRETGYRAGDASTATANRIARVWAALPKVGGPGAGRSAWQGIAGNHALVKSSTYRGVLECRIAVADTLDESGDIRAGRQFGFARDGFVNDLARAAKNTAAGMERAATSLLLILFTLDLVMRAGRWAIQGEPANVMDGLLFRLMAVLVCLGVITAGGDIIAFMAKSAARLAGSAGGQQEFAQDFSMAEFAASKMALAFSLFEGTGAYSGVTKTLIRICSWIIIVLGGLQMAVVIYWYARLFLGAASGLLVVGFGGLTQTMSAVQAWMFSLMAVAFSLMALLVILTILPGLSWDLRSGTTPVASAFSLIFLEMLALLLILLLPKSAGAIIRPGPA